MKQERLDSMDYFERTVLPALFENLDNAFPDFGWTRRTGSSGWVASKRDFTKSLPGAPRPDRVVCNMPSGFYVHGGSGTSWAAYLNGGSTPRGAQFWDVARQLANLAGVDTSPLELERTPEQDERYQKRLRREGLLEAFHALTRNALTLESGAAQQARGYLQDRGFGDLEALPLGLCPPLEEVQKTLEAQGFTAEELKPLRRDSRWEGRLVIPWRDRWGQLETFAARDLTGQAEEGSKYLYLSRARKPGFCGLDVALRSPEGRENLVLVEGLLDVLTFQALGFPNVAALGGNGNGLVAARWELLAGFGVRTVTLALDNDEPGREGLLAAIENASKASNVPNVYVVDPAELGEHKDPDAFVRRGKGLEAFRSLLEGALPASLYRAQAILGNVSPSSPDRERQEAAGQAVDFVDRLRGGQAALDREDVLRLTEERTGYTFEALLELAENRATRRRKEEQERALDAALREAQRARTEGRDAFEVSSALAENLSSLRSRSEALPPFFSVDRLLRESRELPEGKPSGWAALDNLDVRFHAGELSLLAARTGHGKTSVLVNLLRNWLKATEGTDEVLVLYSAEEPEARIFHRLLSLESANAGGRGRTANEVRDLLRNGQDLLDEEACRLRAWEHRLLVVHRSGWTAQDIDAHARTIASSRSLGAVLVDYLQRIPAPSRESRRDIEVSAVARYFKSLAVDLSCPVVAAAQINREAVPDRYRENLSGKDYENARSTIQKARPALHHLREGGSEQEADLVLGLLNYRADLEETEENRVPDVTRFELGTLKTRYAAPGRWATLAFEGRFGLLRDLDPREEL